MRCSNQLDELQRVAAEHRVLVKPLYEGSPPLVRGSHCNSEMTADLLTPLKRSTSGCLGYEVNCSPC